MATIFNAKRWIYEWSARLSSFDPRATAMAFLAVSMVVCAGPAMAATFSLGPEGWGIEIAGEIRPGDYARFRQRLTDLAFKQKVMNVAILNSPGGDVAEALKFGEEFNSQLYTALIPQDGECVSACTIMFAGAVQRDLWSRSKLGFHRLSLVRSEVDIDRARSKTGSMMDKVTNFFRSVAFPSILIDRMNETPPTQIFWVDHHWIKAHDIERQVSYQPAFLDVVEKNCGPDPGLKILQYGEVDKAIYQKWLACADSIRETNRQIRARSRN